MLIIQNTLNNTRRYGETAGLHEAELYFIVFIVFL